MASGQKSILDESQADRDAELAEYLGLSVDDVREAWNLEDNQLRAGPVVWDGDDFDADSYNHLYERPLYGDELCGALRAFSAFIVNKRGWMARRVEEHMGGFDTPVLDFGCGVGSHGIYALERGAPVVDFLDVDGPTRAYAHARVMRRGLEDRARFMGPDDVFEKSKYGAVFLIDVLEHIANPVKAFEQIMTATMPDAVVAMQFGFGGDCKQGHFTQSRKRWMEGKARIAILQYLKPIEKKFFFKRKKNA